MAKMIEDPTQPFEVVLDEDKDLPEAERSVFLMLPMSVVNQHRTKQDLKLGRDADRLTLQRQLRGWRNYPAGAEDNYRFATTKKGEPTEDTLDLMPAVVRAELAAKSLTADGSDTLSEEERGNSDSP